MTTEWDECRATHPSASPCICVFNIFFACAILVASFAEVNAIVLIADVFVLSLSIPNLIGVYMLSGLVKEKIISYEKRLKSGAFDK